MVYIETAGSGCGWWSDQITGGVKAGAGGAVNTGGVGVGAASSS